MDKFAFFASQKGCFLVGLVKYFYQVILYQERKPGTYTKFDDHMRRVIILEFYKRIITAYLEKNK